MSIKVSVYAKLKMIIYNNFLLLHDIALLHTSRVIMKKKKKYNRNEEFQPLVFVYIPTYNRGTVLIERSVASVLRQSYKNFKLFVIGDGCTDDTEKLLSEIEDDRLSFINIFPRKDRKYPDVPFYHWIMGATIPANYALSIVTSEYDYIARVDDDDVWKEDHLELSLLFIKENNIEFMTSNQSYTDNNGNTTISKARHVKDEYYTQKPTPEMNRGPRIGGMSSIVYASYLSFIKFNKYAWLKKWNAVNDVDFLLRNYKVGVKMGFSEKVLSSTTPLPGRSNFGSKGIEDKKDHELY